MALKFKPCSLIIITLLQIFRLKVLLHQFLMLGNWTEVFDVFRLQQRISEMSWVDPIHSLTFYFLLLQHHAPMPQGLAWLLLPTCKPGRCPDMKIWFFAPKNKAISLVNIFFFLGYFCCVYGFFFLFSFGLHVSDMLECCFSGDFV